MRLNEVNTEVKETRIAETDWDKIDNTCKPSYLVDPEGYFMLELCRNTMILIG